MKKQSDLSRLMEYAGKHKYFTYASWLLAAISALIALLPFIYIWKIIKEVLDVAPNLSAATGLVYNGIMAMVFAIASFLIYICALICSHLAAFRVATNMRIIVTEHIAKLPLGFADSFGSGKLRKIINDSTGATETYLAHQLPDKYAALATPVGLLVLLFVFDWRLGLLSLIPVVLAFLAMSSMTGKHMAEKMKQYNNALENMSNEAVEYVRGIPVVKTFGQSVFSFKKFKSTIDEYQKWVVAYTKDMRVPMMFYTASINGVFAFLIAGALWFTADGVTNEFLLNLIFYIVITPVISLTLTKMMYMSENNMIVKDTLERIDGVLSVSPMSESKTPEHPADSSVELNDVHFSYDGKNEVIRGVSMNIGAGQTVAFVGPSGGGKSTLAGLMARFFDVKSGSIKVGGADIREIPKEELMNAASFVFQDSKLIKATIAENVKLGKPDATDEEVLNAARLANVDEFAEKLPDKWNTNIGENGCELSGGERQRISIARAFLKDAPIILLDEATASLDVENETMIQTALSRLIKDKTVLIIAHRMRTVAGADKIVVLADGVVAEQGTPGELYKKDGIYARMVDLQSASGKWKIK